MRETSLEDFLDGSDDGSPDSDPDSDPNENGTGDFEDATDECNEPGEHDDAAEGPTESAQPTYAWTPDNAACSDCGRDAGQRWWDDGAFVCAECKTW